MEKFINGNFFIERTLKKYAIFINEETEDVYGVLGLYDSLEEIIPKNMFPVYVKAILLPLKDKIVYDGLLQTYSLFFGKGISKGISSESIFIGIFKGTLDSVTILFNL